MWRRITGICIFLVLILPASSAAQAPPESEQIQRMLDARAQAFERGDRQIFLSNVHADARDFAVSQGEWFDRTKSLPVRNLSYRLRLDRYGELTRRKDENQFGVGAMVAVVHRRYDFEGFSVRPWLEELIWTFVETEAGWTIASDLALDDLGIYSDRQLWEFGPVTTRSSDHFIVIAHPEDSEFASSLLGPAEASLLEVDRVWKREWTKRIPIVVASAKLELERLLGATFDVENFVAFAIFSVDIEKDFEAAGTRVVINRNNFARHSAASRQSILAHELVHCATREASGPFVPIWMEEGLAQLAESRGRPNTRLFDGLVDRGNFDGMVPDDLEFMSGGREAILVAYQSSLSASVFLAETYGVDRLGHFYAELGAGKMQPGTSEYHVDAAMKRALDGLSLEEFQARWTESLARN